MKFDFADYYTEKEGNKTLIRIKYKVPLINKLLMTGAGIYVLFMFLGNTIDSSDPLRFVILGIMLVLVVFGGVIGLFIGKKINKVKKKNKNYY